MSTRPVPIGTIGEFHPPPRANVLPASGSGNRGGHRGPARRGRVLRPAHLHRLGTTAPSRVSTPAAPAAAAPRAAHAPAPRPPPPAAGIERSGACGAGKRSTLTEKSELLLPAAVLPAHRRRHMGRRCASAAPTCCCRGATCVRCPSGSRRASDRSPSSRRAGPTRRSRPSCAPARVWYISVVPCF